MTLQEIIKGTLDWCNEIRRGKGLDPLSDLPKGSKSDAASCPCGNATGAYVGSYSWWRSEQWCMSGAERDGGLPKCVQEFVKRFDQGEIPKYVLQRRTK